MVAKLSNPQVLGLVSPIAALGPSWRGQRCCRLSPPFSVGRFYVFGKLKEHLEGNWMVE